MDDNAKYLINLEIDRNKERLGLSDDAARTWFSRWTHNQLAKYVIKLWSGSSHAQNDTIDNAYQKFKIDVNSSQLDINNVSGEQHLITSLHKIRETYGTSESDLPENQSRFVKMLKDKIGKQSPYTLDMNACFSDHKKWPSKTVSDWINCFAHVRANVRLIQSRAARYGPVTSDSINNDPIKRQKNNNGNRSDRSERESSKNDDKASARKSEFDRKKNHYNASNNCYKCGSWLHKRADCTSKNPDCNKEDILFHQRQSVDAQ
jgi:hypothetical protein